MASPNLPAKRRSTGDAEVLSDKMTALALKAKATLNEGRNIKTEIKTATFSIIDKMVALAKESEKLHKHEKGASRTLFMECLQELGVVKKAITNLQESQISREEDSTRTMQSLVDAVYQRLEQTDRLNRALEDQTEKVSSIAREINVQEELIGTLSEQLREGVASVNSTQRLWERLSVEQTDTHRLIAKQTIEKVEQVITDSISSTPPSYAEITARPPSETRPTPPAFQSFHSVLITPTDPMETSAEVIERVKGVLDAKRNGIKVERVRKVKDGRVVLSCATRAELERAEEQLRKTEHLKVVGATNKNPLVVLKYIQAHNTDEDILQAITRQNGHLLEGLSESEAKAEVRYRRRARDSSECHAILRVAPKLWQRLTSAGRLYVDLQVVKVADQSPLVQCTRCLGFGHGRKLCTESVDLCNYCGGPHLKAGCPSLLAAQAPTCKNCTKAKYTDTTHHAFSDECPIRKKWDALARASVAYS